MNANDQLPGTDLEKLLSTFFKSELPDPFPKMKLSTARAAEPPMPAAPRSTPSERRPALTKSRFSLAVSVALLIGGCWYLSGQIGTPNPRPTASKNGGGEATLPDKLDPNKNVKPPTMP